MEREDCPSRFEEQGTSPNRRGYRDCRLHDRSSFHDDHDGGPNEVDERSPGSGAQSSTRNVEKDEESAWRREDTSTDGVTS